MKTLARILIPVFLLLPFFATAAEEASAINQRMDERLPAIIVLKKNKIVGENNTGFLEVRGSATADEQKLVSDDNADRKAIYVIIARYQSTSAEAVGKTRARQIAEKSPAGFILQAADGAWYQKK